MRALTYSTAPDLGHARATLEKLRAQFGPLAMVIGAHALLFFLMSNGMLTRMVDAAVPQALLVSFVTLPPAQTVAPPSVPKTVPLARIAPPALPPVPLPALQLATEPNLISVTPAVAPAASAAAPIAALSAAPVASGPKTITSGVEYLQAPQPVYPEMSKRMGEQGKVILRVLVNENGKPGQVQVQISSGSARLDEAGRQAALRALFKPHLEDGRAVAVYVIVPLNFQLAG